MKVKEIDRTANIAWSPAAYHPIYLAAGTAAQQLDATFSTTASLEMYDLSLTEPGLDMTLKGSLTSGYRFHKLVWGCMSSKISEKACGVLVGGADGGSMLMYDPTKLLNGEDAILHHKTKHSGAVHALDFNKFQDYLLASGANDSEIYIWDLNNPSSPMSPGAKSEPADDVTSVAWNCQVQHILASTVPARCVVWDLRKNEPIIKVSDSAAKLRCKMVAWHPEIATQLCIASDDDHSPLIQLWDLRFATTPIRNLERHQRGVLSIAWCPHDPDLLLSCGKDSKILCWNPNSTIEGGEVICELPTNNQWSFDVSWCLRNPAVIASCSCDGRVSVFSLMGGQQQSHCSSKIAESFPGSDKISPTVFPLSQRHVSVPLKKPPKWLRKPSGSSFGFGGKLVQFVNGSSTSCYGDSSGQRTVYISQVITEPELLKRTIQLETALKTKNFAEFCQMKIEECKDGYEKMNWTFLQATFSASPRTKMLSLLGYDCKRVKEELTMRIYSDSGRKLLSDENLASAMGLITVSPKTTESLHLSPEAYARESTEDSFTINAASDDLDGVLSRALLTGNIEAAVELCIQGKRWADALILAQAGGHDLLQKTQKLYLHSASVHSSSKLIYAIGTSDWTSVVKNCDIESWREGLAAILTYAKPEEFTQLCELLGSRLETERERIYIRNAPLCYISSGNLERLAQCWSKLISCKKDTSTVQCLVEQVMILKSAVEQLSADVSPVEDGELSHLLGLHASTLASQGHLVGATMYLSNTKEKSLAVLRDRIYQALGQQTPYFPFKVVNVQKTPALGIPCQQRNLYEPNSFQSLTQPQSFDYSGGDMKHPTMLYSFPNSNNAQQLQSPLFPSVPASSLSLPVHTSISPPADAVNISSAKGTCGHHLSQRYPKHVHDPSVYSEHTFNQQYFPVSQAQSTGFSLHNLQQQPVMNYYSTESNVPIVCSSNDSNITCPSAFYGSSSSCGTQVPTSSASEPVLSTSFPMSALPSMYGEMKTGWNDPPLLRRASGAEASSSAYDAPPITVPLVPAPDISPIVPVTTGGYSNVIYTPSQNQSVNTVKEAVTPMQSPSVPIAEIPQLPKERKPIPPEHEVLHDVFENLRHNCLQVATNPQIKRKLEDVAKKLQYLYDQLRENELSQPVLVGLHQIIQAIFQHNYQAALVIHGQIVSTTNFSEISGFMPSVKVLLQTASQLGVFLQ